MRKSLTFLLAFCALILSCQVEEIQEDTKEIKLDYNDSFHASIDINSTKTVMDADNNIRWSSEDQLIIFKKTSLGLKYQIQDEYVGETSGYFSKVISDNPSDDFGAGMSIPHNIAYYPFSDNVKFAKSGEDYTLKVTLPSEQHFAHESFGNGAFHMAAVSDDTDLTFKNVMGGIKFLFKGVGEVVSVKIEGNDGELISGMATVTVYTGDKVPQVTMAETAATTIELKCGNGVQLNEETATEFIIAVPPTDFEKGFTLTVTDPQGNEEIVATSKQNIVSRSTILVMPEKTLTVIEPKDYSTDLSAEKTANCYIVSEPGEYRFRPTKGNSSQSAGTIATAEVLWESFGTETVPAVGDLITNVRLSGKYIKFETPAAFAEGNAVIAAKDANGKILWSWHIWFTDKPEEHVYPNNAGTFMDRNLGATSVTPGDVTSLGLHYQWGRKDPFLNASTTTPDYDAVSLKASSTGTWSKATTSSYIGTIDYATKNPTTFIRGDSYSFNDWLYYGTSNSIDNTRWASAKTIYDPCPAGWRVPDGGGYGLNGPWAVAGFDNAVFDETNHGTSFNTEIWYPASGGTSYNGDHYGVGTCGFYWTVTPKGYDTYSLSFSGTGISTSNTDDRTYGYSVRCFKEGSADFPVEPSPETPEDGDYVDADGINHGQGVMIDNTVWAPVNVGASSAAKYGTYYTWNSAHHACPEGWRLPHKSEMETLVQNSQHAVLNGVQGMWMSGSKSSTNPASAIFLPAAGDESGNIGHDYCGVYFSGTAGWYRNEKYTIHFTTSENPSVTTSGIGSSQKAPVRCVLIQDSEAAESEKTIDGLTWATKNVGACTITETGNYYQSSFLPCPDGWRAPTFEDMKVLKQNSSELVTVDGVQGRWFSGSNTTSDSSTGIFLPMAGIQYLDRDGGTKYDKSAGWYWTENTWLLIFDESNCKLDRINYSGRATPLRCVKGEYTGPALESAVSTPVTIDGLTWSQKNLGAESVNDHGELYTIDEAKTACPEGWRLPTKEEIKSLTTNYSWDLIDGTYGLLCYGSGQTGNEHPAVFLPASEPNATWGQYWTSSEQTSSYGYNYVALFFSSSISTSGYSDIDECSVRCVQ